MIDNTVYDTRSAIAIIAGIIIRLTYCGLMEG